MRKTLILWALLPMVMLIACGRSEKREEAAYAAADSASLTTSLNSEVRKKIKTADLRCRVTDVLKTTASLERLVVSMDGVVEESTLENEVQNQCTLPLSADSIRLVKRYIPVANLTLRVPAQHLDSLVAGLTSMAAFIDYRKLQDKDVTLAYERNAMKNAALTQQANTRETNHTKMNNELEIAQHQDAKAEAAVDRTIDNLEMLDKVAFSTITVQLFQPETVDIQVAINPDKFSRPEFSIESLNALQNGVTIFRELILFLLRIWPLWVLAITGWILYKKYFRKAAGL